MASRCCRVSFTDAERVEHAVEVSAATLYEACVLALAEFRRVGFVDAVFGPATVLTVRVMAPSTAHSVSVGKLRAWLAVRGRSPHELLVKQKLRGMLDGV